MVLAVFKAQGFDDALDKVRQIFETGGSGHSCGIYSFNDEHINRLALMAPVSRIMVRQVQSSSNAGTFTNGMPMTSSMGCGIWGGNITNENVSLKHYMNVTWVSRPIAEDKPSEAELFGEFYNTQIPDRKELNRHGHRQSNRRQASRAESRDADRVVPADRVPRAPRRRGDLRPVRPHGHRVSRCARKSRIRFISTRHEQIAAHAADGYARASGKVGVLLTHLGPGLTNAATGVANAALDSIPMVVIAGDIPCYYYGRHPHQEVNLHQDADQFQIFRPFCKRVYRVDNVEDLPRIVERAFHLAQTGRPGPVLVDVPMDIFSADLDVDAFAKTPPEIAKSGLDPATAARIVDALATSRRPVLYAGGGVFSARATEELQDACRGAASPRRAYADGEGLPAARASAAARPVRVLGHADRERKVPHGRSDRRDRHAARRSQLELVGSALHVLDSADAADSHRCRPLGDRPQLPDRAGRRARTRSSRWRPWLTRRAASGTPIAAG